MIDDNISEYGANNITLDVKARSPKYTDTYHLNRLRLRKHRKIVMKVFLHLYQKDLLLRSQCV